MAKSPRGGYKAVQSRAMRNVLFTYEPFIRLGGFASVFIIMAVWEFIVPRRKQAIGRLWRGAHKICVVIFKTGPVRNFFFPPPPCVALLHATRGVCLFSIITLPPLDSSTAPCSVL